MLLLLEFKRVCGAMRQLIIMAQRFSSIWQVGTSHVFQNARSDLLYFERRNTQALARDAAFFRQQRDFSPIRGDFVTAQSRTMMD
ncbi:hypothetical protein ACWYXN_00845 [Janthinobacterium aestuarii]